MATETKAPVTKEDIQAKLADIQGEATNTVSGAKNQILATGIGVALILLIVAFLLGRSGGLKKNTIIEITRS